MNFTFILYTNLTFMSRRFIKLTPFYIRFREIRELRNKTQTSCAACMGVSLRSYQYYEAGDREPNIAALIALADFFDVTLDYLMGRTDS